jgi:hypothetical protein
MHAELALLGRFRYVPARLFLKRFHADVSKGVERLSEHRQEILLTYDSAAAGHSTPRPAARRSGP